MKSIIFIAIFFSLIPITINAQQPVYMIERSIEDYDPDEFNNVLFTPDSKYAVLHGRWPAIYVWDLESGNIINTFSGHDHHANIILDADVSSDGKSVSSIDLNNILKIWDIFTGEERAEIFIESEGTWANARECKFFNDDQQIYVETYGTFAKRKDFHGIYVYDIDLNQIIRRIENFPDGIGKVERILPDGEKVLTQSGVLINLNDLETGISPKHLILENRVYDKSKTIPMFDEESNRIEMIAIDRVPGDRFFNKKEVALKKWDVNGKLQNKKILNFNIGEGFDVNISNHLDYIVSKKVSEEALTEVTEVILYSIEDENEILHLKKDEFTQDPREGFEVVKVSPDGSKAIVTIGAKALLYTLD